MTESRKACLRRGDSVRERAGVPEKSKHRRQTTQLPKSARKKQSGPCPNTRYFFRLSFYVHEMGRAAVTPHKGTNEVNRHRERERHSCYQNRETQ